MINDDANEDDIIGFLIGKNAPEDKSVYNNLASEILTNILKVRFA